MNCIPLVGDLQLGVQSTVRICSPTLVELGPVQNEAVWAKAYALRGCKTARDKRRLDYAHAHALLCARLTDRQVVELLGTLAIGSKRSPIRLQIMQLVDRILERPTLLCNTPEWECLREIIGMSVSPDAYQSADDYLSDVQLVKFLAKYPFQGAEETAEDVAITKLLRQEELNALTNRRWRDGTDFTTGEALLIETIHDELAEILGPPPSPEDVLDCCAWGPGTLVGYPFGGNETGSEMKFASQHTCTPSLTSVADWVLASYPSWRSHLVDAFPGKTWVTVVPGDILFTVPKKFEEHRCAMKQPSVNAWLQRGVGITIRKRLRARARVKLQNQQARNKELARIGSATGQFATIDLSSASDSNCRAVMRSLLDPGWFAWVYSTASKQFTLPQAFVDRHHNGRNRPRQYEMISSMGCGYTFELETAVFLSVVRSIVPCTYYETSKGQVLKDWSHVGVYGDDIICPVAYADAVIQGLNLLGFRVNALKSFTSKDGPFRESCGGDYFRGTPVRPLYATHRLENGFSIVSLLNRIAEQSLQDFTLCPGLNLGLGDARFRRLHTALLKYLPSSVIPLISTPPYVQHGLWVVQEKETTWELYTGQPAQYRVFIPEPVKIDLGNSYFQYGDRAWPVPANGYNLLASRLSNLDTVSDPDQDQDPWSRIVVGSGQSSVVRGDIGRVIPGLSRVSYSARWLGWSA